MRSIALSSCAATVLPRPDTDTGMPHTLPRPFTRIAPWPLPALLVWLAAWAAALACRHAGAVAGVELAAGAATGVALAGLNAGWRRRAIAALGFPLSALLLAALAGRLTAGVWLLAGLPLLLLYPLRAWRDAPFFPTPAAALKGLDELIRPPPRHVLDAGCGLGHGLAALQGLWPQAALQGVEWSAPMAWLAARRVPRAAVRRGDMWAHAWSGLDLVYLFQRPESMARAWAKACAEMEAGAWFVSLEFEVPGVTPTASVDAGIGRPLFAYRVQSRSLRAAAAGSTAAGRGR